jgi:hypothetical protein
MAQWADYFIPRCHYKESSWSIRVGEAKRIHSAPSCFGAWGQAIADYESISRLRADHKQV